MGLRRSMLDQKKGWVRMCNRHQTSLEGDHNVLGTGKTKSFTAGEIKRLEKKWLKELAVLAMREK